MNEKTYKKHLTIWIIVTILLVIASFFMGSKHGQNVSKKNLLQLRGGTGMNGGMRMGGRFGAGGGVVTGSVLSKDATSITVKLRDGSSKIVLYSGSTQVLKSTQGTADDVAIGSQISVIGTQNTDGSVTAQSVQIRPNIPIPTTGTPAQTGSAL